MPATSDLLFLSQCSTDASSNSLWFYSRTLIDLQITSTLPCKGKGRSLQWLSRTNGLTQASQATSDLHSEFGSFVSVWQAPKDRQNMAEFRAMAKPPEAAGLRISKIRGQGQLRANVLQAAKIASFRPFLQLENESWKRMKKKTRKK